MKQKFKTLFAESTHVCRICSSEWTRPKPPLCYECESWIGPGPGTHIIGDHYHLWYYIKISRPGSLNPRIQRMFILCSLKCLIKTIVDPPTSKLL